jgi:hypothetical protein
VVAATETRLPDGRNDDIFLCSADGINWSKPSMKPIRDSLRERFPYWSDDYVQSLDIHDVFADGSRLIAIIQGEFFESTDGVGWSHMEFGSTGQRPNPSITISDFKDAMTANGWTWDSANRKLTGEDTSGSRLFPASGAAPFDFTALGNLSDLYIYLTASVAKAPFGNFSISLKDQNGNVSAYPFAWSGFVPETDPASTIITYGTSLERLLPEGFLWNNVVTWQLEADGSGEPVEATFARLWVEKISNPSIVQSNPVSSYSVSWMGRFDGDTYVMDERGGIGRIAQDGVSYIGEAGRDALFDWGMSMAGLEEVIVAGSKNSTAYARSTAGGPFASHPFVDGYVPMTISRIGNRLVAAAREESQTGIEATRFYQSLDGISWHPIGRGSFVGDRLQLAGASVEQGPVLLACTEMVDHDENLLTPDAPQHHLYLSTQGLINWGKQGLPLENKPQLTPPLTPDVVLDLDVQWDGKRFLLRDKWGVLWQSSTGQTDSWSKLPDLPADSRGFLLATARSEET